MNRLIANIIYISITGFFVVQLIKMLVLLGQYDGIWQQKKTPITVEGELTSKDMGEPYSDWEKFTTGSAGYLDGSTVLVSLFLDDKNANWTSADKALAMNNMKIAVDYLVEEGKRYGKKVDLIYDINEHEDLEYHIKYDGAFPGSTEVSRGDDVERFIYAVYDYIEDHISIKDIMEKYDVNSIAFVCFVDGETDVATAYQYVSGKNYYYEEVCFINLRWKSNGQNVNPDTYAHEILHLFGARDLYYTSAEDGVSKEFIEYVAKNYPKDIMLGHGARCVSYPDYISAEITKITAYYLGWVSYVYEMDLFPSAKADYPATKTIVQNPTGNYEEYEIETRRIGGQGLRNLQYQTFIYFVASFFLIYDFIRVWRKSKRYGNQDADAFIEQNANEIKIKIAPDINQEIDQFINQENDRN